MPGRILGRLLVAAALAVAISCDDDDLFGRSDLAPFIERAQQASCADVRNRLFVIDEELIFWDQAGTCADATYDRTLFGRTPEDVLCFDRDSVGGPVRDFPDERFRDLFETMIDKLEAPDLGLGAGHTVRPVPI